MALDEAFGRCGALGLHWQIIQPEAVAGENENASWEAAERFSAIKISPAYPGNQ
jgi:hypothetical protein